MEPSDSAAALPYRKRIKKRFFMTEKIYKTMRSVGIFNIVMGIIFIAAGIAAGVLVMVNGARLIKNKSELMF